MKITITFSNQVTAIISVPKIISPIFAKDIFKKPQPSKKVYKQENKIAWEKEFKIKKNIPIYEWNVLQGNGESLQRKICYFHTRILGVPSDLEFYSGGIIATPKYILNGVLDINYEIQNSGVGYVPIERLYGKKLTLNWVIS